MKIKLVLLSLVIAILFSSCTADNSQTDTPTTNPETQISQEPETQELTLEQAYELFKGAWMQHKETMEEVTFACFDKTDEDYMLTIGYCRTDSGINATVTDFRQISETEFEFSYQYDYYESFEDDTAETMDGFVVFEIDKENGKVVMNPSTEYEVELYYAGDSMDALDNAFSDYFD